MGRRRTGSAWERAPGVWLAAFTLADGTRHTERVPARKSGAPVDRAYARAFAAERQRQVDEGEWHPAPVALSPQAHSVGTWCAEWAARQAYDSAPHDAYLVSRYVLPHALAAVPLRALTAADALAWLSALRASPSRLGGLLAPRTVRAAVSVVRRALKEAVAVELLARDPFAALPRGAIPPSRDKVPGARRGWAFDVEEIRALCTSDRVPVDRRVLYAVAFATGARISEAAALRWSDWSPTRLPLGCLTVSRGVVRRARKLREQGTKTGAVKEVPIHPALALILGAWFARGWAAFVGRSPAPRDHIVPLADGGPRWAARSWRHLQADCRGVGIPPRRIHGTRHTTIRLARDAGAEREAIRELTHARPEREAFDGYDRPSWERLCREVLRLEVPFQREGVAVDSATDSATEVLAMAVFPEDSARLDLIINQVHGSESAAIRAFQSATPGADGALSADSATDSATAGALRGELWALDWLERIEAGELWQ